MSCIVCSFRLASFILLSAVGVTNLLLTKNLVADLQESLSKDILSFSERFSCFTPPRCSGEQQVVEIR